MCVVFVVDYSDIVFFFNTVILAFRCNHCTNEYVLTVPIIGNAAFYVYLKMVQQLSIAVAFNLYDYITRSRVRYFIFYVVKAAFKLLSHSHCFWPAKSRRYAPYSIQCTYANAFFLVFFISADLIILLLFCVGFFP